MTQMSHLMIRAIYYVTEGERAQENRSHNDEGLKTPMVVDRLMHGEKQEIPLGKTPHKPL